MVPRRIISCSCGEPGAGPGKAGREVLIVPALFLFFLLFLGSFSLLFVFAWQTSKQVMCFISPSVNTQKRTRTNAYAHARVHAHAHAHGRARTRIRTHTLTRTCTHTRTLKLCIVSSYFFVVFLPLLNYFVLLSSRFFVCFEVMLFIFCCHCSFPPFVAFERLSHIFILFLVSPSALLIFSRILPIYLIIPLLLFKQPFSSLVHSFLFFLVSLSLPTRYCWKISLSRVFGQPL